jgi:hypothetical protein
MNFEIDTIVRNNRAELFADAGHDDKGGGRHPPLSQCENAIDLDSGAARQIGDADGRARVAAIAAEQLMNEIGSAIDDLRYFVEMRTAIDKAAEANAGGDAIEGSPTGRF